MRVIRVAVVGDVHLQWDGVDTRLLDEQGYDLTVFVGDLAGYSHTRGLTVASEIGRVGGRVLVMPGNHDATHLPHLLAEVFSVESMRRTLGGRMHRRVDALARCVGPERLCGYTLHPFPDLGFTVLAARPHTMGGARLAFVRYMARRFGVRSMQDSARRLCELIDTSSGPLLVLAHNGPTGLGDRRHDLWGCDFRREEGDHGDPDLRAALDHALAQGRRVLAVVAGHMHRSLRGGGERIWKAERDGVLYVNAAEVPRVRRRDGALLRHHVRLEMDPGGVRAEDVWLSGD